MSSTRPTGGEDGQIRRRFGSGVSAARCRKKSEGLPSGPALARLSPEAGYDADVMFPQAIASSPFVESSAPGHACTL